MRFVRWLMVAAVFSVPGTAVFAASPLEGTLWQMEITQEGMTLPQYVDRVRFEEGKLVSVIFTRKGFPTVSYTEAKKGDSVVWGANQKSDALGELEWHGELMDGKITGALVFKQTDGTAISYALSGTPAVEESEEGVSGEGTVAPAAVKKTKKGFFGCSLGR